MNLGEEGGVTGRLVSFVMGAAVLGLTGCQPPLATVEGQVRYQGQPLRGGSIILYCADGQIVRGLIAPDGRYQVVNVPYGTARVAIQAHGAQPDGLRLPQKLPPVRNGPISPAGLPPSDPRVVPLPARYAYPEESGLTLLVDRPVVNWDWDLSP
jgi:hypothetical protein